MVGLEDEKPFLLGETVTFQGYFLAVKLQGCTNQTKNLQLETTRPNFSTIQVAEIPY